MRDEDIFKKLNKQTPLVKRKDLQPLSTKDFTQKRSAFDLLMEKTNDKREERRGGFRTKPGSYHKTDGHDDDRSADVKQGGLSLHGNDERVQRPQPRTIQARSETRIRGEGEPIKRLEVRTVAAQPYNPQRTEPERMPRPESPSVSAQISKPQSNESERTVRLEDHSVKAQSSKPLSNEPEHTARPQGRAETQPQNPMQEDAPRMERALLVNPAQPPEEKYMEPARTRMSSIREAYSSADAAELEIFEPAPKRSTAVRTDEPALAPMRQQRTEFEEYFEPEQQTEAQPAFRHELKYYINYTDYILLRNTLKVLAQLDKYAGESGEYSIRSLYFDDVYESALMEKLGGSDFRKKFRVRIYNFSDDVIKFEKKIKQGQFVTKKSIGLSRDEYDRILAGEYEFLLRRKEPLASELFLELKNNRLRPRVIVDYVREAYVYPFENIRITFDKDLRSGMWLSDIFDPKAPTMPMYEEGMMVLEVKFEKSLPAHIRGVLGNIQSPQRSAISKYVICRKFE